jgi:hypothetical protein
MASPVLDLTTQDPQVRIDDQLYTLRVADDLTIIQNVEFSKANERVEALRVKGKLSKAEGDEVAKHLEFMCGMVLEAPAAVRAKLSVIQRLNIVNGFFELVANASTRPLRRSEATAGAATTRPADKRTSAKSSRG